MNKTLIYLTFLFLLIPFINAQQSTQQYNQIYLDPYYRTSLTAGTNYNYTLNVNTPDGLSQVKSAIINFNAQINGQTQTFTLKVNNQSCNPPTYSVATAYSTTGNIQFGFDCSNIITRIGQYNITLSSAVNTGAITSWLELTYMNKPNADITIHGTEYTYGQTSKAWLQLINNSNPTQAITTGICFVDIYNPDHTEFVEHAQMTNAGHDGIYYYDVVLPYVEGVYAVIARCYYDATEELKYATSYNLTNATLVSGTINDTTTINNVNLQTSETTVASSYLNWWNSSWTNRINITIKNVGTTTLLNYPAYLNITKRTVMLSNYSDIRFINGSCGSNQTTQLNYEIDNYTTTQANVWINIPSLATGNTTICMYYGNNDANDGQNPTSVWDSNYVMVQHLEETTGLYIDTTSNNNDGTNSGATRTTTGKIGLAPTFDGGTNLIQIAYNETMDLSRLTNWTIEAWVKPTVLAGTQYPVIFAQGNYRASIGLSDTTGGTDGRIESWINDASVATATTPSPLSTWSFVALGFNTSGRYFFFNGKTDGTGTYVNPTDANEDFGIGNTRPQRNDGGFNGMIDEVRISNVVRTADWLNQTYSLVNNQATYVTVGNIERLPKTYEAIFDFNNQNICANYSELLLNGIGVSWTGQWNDVSEADNLIIQLYNHTSGTWLNLPNQIPPQASSSPAMTVTNSLQFNNISRAGLVNSTGSNFRIKIKDTVNTDNITTTNIMDKLVMTCEVYANPTWQSVQGSSEFHLSASINLTEITNITATNQNWLIQIWNWLNGYLTNQTITINQKLDTLLNQTNTSQLITISTTTDYCITGSQWEITAYTKDLYNTPLTNLQANCTINTSLWGNSNMTYTPIGIWTYTQPCPTPSNWTWQITCI